MAALALCLAGVPSLATGEEAAADGVDVAEGAEAVAMSDEEAKAESAGLEPWFSLLGEQPGFASGGFTEDRTALEFYWHGPLPDEALAIIAEAEREGQRIIVRHVTYSWEEIMAVGEKLRRELDERGVFVSAVGPNRAQDVVWIAGPELSSDPELHDLAQSLAAPILPDGVTLRIEPYEEPVDADTRHDDTGDPTVGAEVTPSP